jgi:hypothetical protein
MTSSLFHEVVETHPPHGLVRVELGHFSAAAEVPMRASTPPRRLRGRWRRTPGTCATNVPPARSVGVTGSTGQPTLRRVWGFDARRLSAVRRFSAEDRDDHRPRRDRANSGASRPADGRAAHATRPGKTSRWREPASGSGGVQAAREAAVGAMHDTHAPKAVGFAHRAPPHTDRPARERPRRSWRGETHSACQRVSSSRPRWFTYPPRVRAVAPSHAACRHRAPREATRCTGRWRP